MTAFRISSLWRYPVKSMAGEELNAVDVTASGLRGDRAYALVDSASGKVGSAKSVKRFGELLKYHAKFVTPPESEGVVPPVRITLPDGTVLDSEQPDDQVALAAAFGSQVSLRSTAPDGLMLEFAPGTLGGKYAKATEVPVAGAAPRGTLFDYACIHIVTTSALQRLQEAYPEGQFSVQRFRPNIVVDCAGESGFVENSWVGHTLVIGPELILRVSIPCPRCVMTTLPRVDLPHDPRILRTAVQLNMQNLGDFGDLPCVGVYADVVKPGRIRSGDAVRIGD
jgi:MOSC domain-containing protein